MRLPGTVALTRRQTQTVVLLLACLIPAVLVMLGVQVARQFTHTDAGGPAARATPETVTVETPAGAAARPAPAPASNPDADPDLRSVVAWAAANLPHDAAIAADDAALPALRRAGFSRAVADTSGTRAVSYLVTSARTPSTGSRLSEPSAPLARAGQVSVREMSTDSPDRYRSQLRDDAALRRLGGGQLLANPALRADAAARAALRAGEVDLRVQNVLGELAGSGAVRVSDPVRDPREARAGRAVRSVAITTTDAAATASYLRGLPEPYRPSALAVVRDTVRVQWRPAAVTAVPVGN